MAGVLARSRLGPFAFDLLELVDVAGDLNVLLNEVHLPVHRVLVQHLVLLRELELEFRLIPQLGASPLLPHGTLQDHRAALRIELEDSGKKA